MKKPKKNWKIPSILAKHVTTNLKEYLVLTSLFILGTIIGVIFINNLSDNQMSEIKLYIDEFLGLLKEDKTINNLELLKSSITQNIILAIILWFVGSTLIGLPIVYGIIAFRGFCLGYTISAVMSILGSSKGICFVLTTMLLQNIIFIPCILALGVSGTKLYQTIMKDKRRENIKLAIVKHTLFSLIICVLLIFSSVVEVYISTSIFNAYLKFI